MTNLTHNTIAYSLAGSDAQTLWVVRSSSKGWHSVECVEAPDGYAIAVGDTRKVRAKQLDTSVEYVERDGHWHATLASDDPTVPEGGFAYDDYDAAEAAGERAWPEANPETPDSETLAGSDDEDEDEDEDDDDVLTPGKLMGRTLRRYAVGYVTVTNANKAKTKVCGDALSLALKDLQPEEVAELASELLDKPANLYDGLNPGQVRMNWGNRLRAAVKRGDLEEDSVLAAILGVVATIPTADAA